VLKSFDELVRRLRDGIRANSIRAETLEELRDTLLPRLISGKLRLPEVQDEVEEATA
jgi:type I restriction enzyme S subunit